MENPSEASLLDESWSLCSRAAFARTRGTDLDWWSIQIGLASSVESKALLKFLLQSVLLWVNESILVPVISSLGTILDRLDEEHWRTFISTTRERPLGRWRERPMRRATLRKVGLPEEMSPRAATILMTRVRPPDQYDIWLRYLRDYNGDDVSVHQAAMRTVAKRTDSRVKGWDVALDVIARGYAKGAVFSALRDPQGGAALHLLT